MCDDIIVHKPAGSQTRTRKNCASSPYPFDKMEIGGWFTLPVTVRTLDSVRGKVYLWAKRHKDHHCNFTIRTSVGEDCLLVTRVY